MPFEPAVGDLVAVLNPNTGGNTAVASIGVVDRFTRTQIIVKMNPRPGTEYERRFSREREIMGFPEEIGGSPVAGNASLRPLTDPGVQQARSVDARKLLAYAITEVGKSVAREHALSEDMILANCRNAIDAYGRLIARIDAGER